MSEIPWFKVLTDIFSDDKIKIIQSMPEGDSLLVMWFKVLSQAGKTNDGGYIYLKKAIPYTPAMLATLFGKQQQIVELAMRVFSEFGMIDVDDKGYIFVTNWEKHQAVDKLAKIKEQNRLRASAHREKKKLELLESNVISNVTVTLPVTRSNAIELDIELDKDKELIPYVEIINYLNEVCGSKYSSKTEMTKKLINGRWNDGHRLDDFKYVIDVKYKEWKGTKQEQYLRPQTLFAPSNFESYLNQKQSTPIISQNGTSIPNKQKKYINEDAEMYVGPNS